MVMVWETSMTIESWCEMKNSENTPNELIFIGGIDSNLWLDNGKQLSRNFKQGYRVYSSEGIACSITKMMEV